MATRGPRMITDANRRLTWVPTLVDPKAPTTTELNDVSALDLSCIITAANYALGATGNDQINEPAYCADNNESAPGRATYEAAMNFWRYKTTVDDVAWTTFDRKNIFGYLVERIGQIPDGERAHEVAWAAGDEVQVYPVLTGTPQVQPISDTASYEKFRMQFHVAGDVIDRAVVAA